MRKPGTHGDEQRGKLIRRRALIVAGAQALVIGALGLRMREMQVSDADVYRMLADENRISIRLLAPERGRLLDRNGRVLARNEPTYQVSIIPEDAGSVQEVLERLQKIISISASDRERILDEAESRSSFVPVKIADRLTWKALSRISINAPSLPGVVTETVMSRAYPAGEDFAHLVGYVGFVNKKELEADEDGDPVLRLPGFRIGKSGAEKALEPLLRGKPGRRKLEVTAAGRVVRELDRAESTPGADLQLTVDRPLQNFAMARLDGQSAAVVVLDVPSGEVLACASSPSFDPNLFVSGISSRAYGAFRDNERRPLFNKALQGTYPPGSTGKMAVALAALRERAATPEEQVYCPGYAEISGRRFHCWKRGGHGHMSLKSALRESCDVYFYEMARRVGIGALHDMNAELGFGEAIDLPVTGVSSGLNPSRQWKQARHGAAWQIGDTINASIGQGFVLATPMQLAVMTARLASGRMVVPRLVKSVRGSVERTAALPGLELDPAWLALVHQGMTEVVNSRKGTAYSSRIVAEAYRMAGKTGSSQVFSITPAERARGVRRQEDLPWNRRDHALFTAFAPIAAPRLAVSVVVEHGGGGSTAAAPVARDVMLFALHGTMPPLNAYPTEQQGRMETLLGDLRNRLMMPTDAAGYSEA